MNKLIITTAALSLILAGCSDKDESTVMKETGEAPSMMEKAVETSKEAVKESATAVSEGTGEAVEAAGETAGEAADSSMEAASGMKEKAGEMVEQAVETVKGMAGETTQETATDAAAKEAGSMIGK